MPSTLSINIQFDKFTIDSIIRINYTSDNPRDIVMGIYNSLKNIIGQNKNLNKIFDPLFPFSLPIIRILIAGLGIAAFFNFLNMILKKEDYRAIFIAELIFLFSAFYIILSFLNPYISFASNRQKSLKKVSNWFFWGFLSFIVFEFFLKKIFGF